MENIIYDGIADIEDLGHQADTEMQKACKSLQDIIVRHRRGESP